MSYNQKQLCGTAFSMLSKISLILETSRFRNLVPTMEGRTYVYTTDIYRINLKPLKSIYTRAVYVLQFELSHFWNIFS